MSHCPHTFSVDFLELSLKRRHLTNFQKSANKFVKKEIQSNNEKEMIYFNIDLLTNFC